MIKTIHYKNTHLELRGPDDLNPLAKYFDTHNIWSGHVTKCDGQKWIAGFEMGNAKEPETNIKKILKVIETLPTSMKLLWDRCLQREFDIGYGCGDKPWRFYQTLSVKLVSRIAAVNASLRITIYPEVE